MRTERIPCWDGKTAMAWQRDDGGREAAGYRGSAGDCVTRAIAIATGLPYETVYDAMNQEALREQRKATTGRLRRSSARTGVRPAAYRRYLAQLGWSWHPTMRIGSGCTVHLCEEELPGGRLIVRVSKHLTAVIDHVVHDTHDPQTFSVALDDCVQRITRRCVYGYFTAPASI